MILGICPELTPSGCRTHGQDGPRDHDDNDRFDFYDGDPVINFAISSDIEKIKKNHEDPNHRDGNILLICSGLPRGYHVLDSDQLNAGA